MQFLPRMRAILIKSGVYVIILSLTEFSPTSLISFNRLRVSALLLYAELGLLKLFDGDLPSDSGFVFIFLHGYPLIVFRISIFLNLK